MRWVISQHTKVPGAAGDWKLQPSCSPPEPSAQFPSFFETPADTQPSTRATAAGCLTSIPGLSGPDVLRHVAPPLHVSPDVTHTFYTANFSCRTRHEGFHFRLWTGFVTVSCSRDRLRRRRKVSVLSKNRGPREFILALGQVPCAKLCPVAAKRCHLHTFSIQISQISWIKS